MERQGAEGSVAGGSCGRGRAPRASPLLRAPPTIGANLDAKLGRLAGPRAERRAEAAGRPLRRTGRGPDHRPPRERRPQRARSPFRPQRRPGDWRPTPTGVRPVHNRVARRGHPARPGFARPVRPRPAAGDRLADVHRGIQRGARLRGTSTRPSFARPSRRRPRSSSPMRASGRCSGAAGLCPAARARHRRQRPDVRGGGHEHRGRSRHGLERKAPVHVVAPVTAIQRRSMAMRPPTPLDAAHHHASVSGLAERPVLGRRRGEHGATRLNGDGTLDLRVTSPAAGETRTFATKAEIAQRPSTRACGPGSISGPPTRCRSPSAPTSRTGSSTTTSSQPTDLARPHRRRVEPRSALASSCPKIERFGLSGASYPTDAAAPVGAAGSPRAPEGNAHRCLPVTRIQPSRVGPQLRSPAWSSLWRRAWRWLPSPLCPDWSGRTRCRSRSKC